MTGWDEGVSTGSDVESSTVANQSPFQVICFHPGLGPLQGVILVVVKRHRTELVQVDGEVMVSGVALRTTGLVLLSMPQQSQRVSEVVVS